MRDFTEDLADVARRVHDAYQYLRIEAARKRLSELESAASDPALWDDPERARKVTGELSAVRDDVEYVADEQPVQQPVRVEKTPGRNEPCFCGSGKKYKLCHGR